ELQKRLRTTSIYVTHDQLEAMTLADRLVVLSAGRVEQIGTPLEVYRRPASAFVAGFIGSPAMNLIPSRAVPHLPGSAHAGMLGIRPEDMEIDPGGPIELRISAVEELGAQRLVHGQVGGEAFTVTMPSDAELGEVLRLSVPPQALHRFDEKTGRRLD
ncbi:MAG: TOBE domain-containing protein, partial [Paracoccus sp. (in: a-proteobacteria)]